MQWDHVNTRLIKPLKTALDDVNTEFAKQNEKIVVMLAEILENEQKLNMSHKTLDAFSTRLFQSEFEYGNIKTRMDNLAYQLNNMNENVEKIRVSLNDNIKENEETLHLVRNLTFKMENMDRRIASIGKGSFRKK